MTDSIQKRLFSYYRSCYQLDTRALSISHAFAKTGGLYTFVDSLEVFSRKGSLFPLPTQTGKAFEKCLAEDGREKALVGWLWPLSATRLTPSGKKVDIFAPAVLYEASLVVDENVYYAGIKLHLAQANPAFTDWISENTTIDITEVSNFLSPLRWNDIAVEQFAKAISTKGEILANLEDHYEYLKQELNENLSKVPQVLPHGGFSIVSKSKGSIGILHELSILANSPNISKPVEELILNKLQAVKSVETINEPILVKASLSDNQKRIVHSSSVNTLTRVVGPPGTGKSFTTAAIASHAYSKNQSVLIVSRNQEAVEVVADKIEIELEMKNLVVRAAKPTSRTKLRNRLKRILNMIGIPSLQTKDFRHTNSLLKTHLKEIKNIEKKIYKHQNSIFNRSHNIYLAKGKWYESILQKYYKRVQERRTNLNDLTSLLIKEEASFQFIVRELQHEMYSARLSKLLTKNLKSLQSFYNGLKERQGVARSLSFAQADFEVILKAFPLWSVTTADLHKVLPLSASQFDLVIIDEASQTDIASSIPALYRAKRAVIIGDPYQLRHVSFVSRDQQTEYIFKYNLQEFSKARLNYREVSILDLAEIQTRSSNQVFMLDEHFRSQPEIIQFSNDTYYGDSLKIMTRGFDEPRTAPLRAFRIQGLQDQSGVNQKEARFLLEELDRIVKLMRHRGVMKTIGILSPFRAQVNFLEREVDKLLREEDFHECKVFIGTPFHFQGEERDVMLLSMAISDESHSSAFSYLERPGVLNVAITRARDVQTVYYSFDPNGKFKNNIVAEYIRRIGQKSKVVTFEDIDTTSKFFSEFKSRLDLIPHVTYDQDVLIAGQRIDILIVHLKKRLAIDFVGIVGIRGQALPIHAVRTLGRINIQVIYLDAFEGVDTCISKIEQELIT